MPIACRSSHIDRARSVYFNALSADNLIVLKYSSAAPKHGPENCLNFKPHTFWMAESPNFAGLCFNITF